MPAEKTAERLGRLRLERARNKTGVVGPVHTDFPPDVAAEWAAMTHRVIREDQDMFVPPLEYVGGTSSLGAGLAEEDGESPGELHAHPKEEGAPSGRRRSTCDESATTDCPADPSAVLALERSIVRHTVTTLARTQFNMDVHAAYQAAAHAVRDRLLARWDATQQHHTRLQCKRVYYLSLEFLMGRTLGNATLNMGIRGALGEALRRLGYVLETAARGPPSISSHAAYPPHAAGDPPCVEEAELDAALGNGGLGRLAACFMDSLATLNYPAWGYGLRYTYGIFRQEIRGGWQAEVPDYWLSYGNPWEVERLDVCYPVRFNGAVEASGGPGAPRTALWTGGDVVEAVAYDVPIPGWGTRSTINIRLWSAKPTRDASFDLVSFNQGDYQRAVEDQQRAESITSVLYPNDNTAAGKELRLKQQYFFVSATLQDILRRFRKTRRPWAELPEHVAIQLNDTHPALGIPELQRLLIDGDCDEGAGMAWDDAWAIVQRVYAFTNHTVLPEALERWPVALVARLLPRHLQIIYDINLYFLQAVERCFPGDRQLLARVSIIEEGAHQHVRMAHLAIIGSHTVNGVAAIHSELIRTHVFADFARVFGALALSASGTGGGQATAAGEKFQNVTNGITPRRWLHQANPRLSALIANRVFGGSLAWLTDLEALAALERHADDAAFQDAWMAVKRANKVRLAEMIRDLPGGQAQVVSPDALFDVQVKRIHEYKRQLLNILGVCHRYLVLCGELPAIADSTGRPTMSPEEPAHATSGGDAEQGGGPRPMASDAPYMTPGETPHGRVFVFGGKAAPGYDAAKLVIRLINQVAETVNGDGATNGRLQVVFVPDYNVSRAEVIVPASDVSQHISTAGTEASGTSNMKFVLNGGLIVGTLDGANVELRAAIERPGDAEMLFVCGAHAEDVEDVRHAQRYRGAPQDEALRGVLSALHAGRFGPVDGTPVAALLASIASPATDHYLVSHDFASYVRAVGRSDAAYADVRRWARASILCSARVGRFSSDRAIREYAERIWRVSPVSEPPRA